MMTIRSVAIDNPNLTYACVTSNDEYGYGVYSWHVNRKDALHNANITKGVVVKVQFDSDGCVILPKEATIAVNKFLGES